ncbi:MAG: glutaredoxin family protein [Xanthomonadaceae bacterium]|jgi:glutaredoxin|nr:glutaredoxin family protein [Xanthomonadaceae bacterium]HRP87903.1 glutaredoxin family protein [Gammaproteobacteria bacterium]
MTVTVYSKPDCPQCDSTRRDLEILGIEYALVDLMQDRAALQRLVGMGYRSAPVVETDRGSWSGYDRERIKALLA